jgi:hypothetical protein
MSEVAALDNCNDPGETRSPVTVAASNGAVGVAVPISPPVGPAGGSDGRTKMGEPSSTFGVIDLVPPG